MPLPPLGWDALIVWSLWALAALGAYALVSRVWR